MDITLHVPVRRFVYKYITAKYGKVWRVRTRGKENLMLTSLLERAPDRYEKYKKNEVMLEIFIPSRLNLLNGNFLSQDSLDTFTHFIHDLLLDEITLYYFGIKNGIGLKKSEKVVTTVYEHDNKIKTRRTPVKNGKNFYAANETVYDILKVYNISDADLTFDSIIKHMQRSAVAR